MSDAKVERRDREAALRAVGEAILPTPYHGDVDVVQRWRDRGVEFAYGVNDAFFDLNLLAQEMANARKEGRAEMQLALAAKFPGERPELFGRHVLEWEMPEPPA